MSTVCSINSTTLSSSHPGFLDTACDKTPIKVATQNVYTQIKFHLSEIPIFLGLGTTLTTSGMKIVSLKLEN